MTGATTHSPSDRAQTETVASKRVGARSGMAR